MIWREKYKKIFFRPPQARHFPSISSSIPLKMAFSVEQCLAVLDKLMALGLPELEGMCAENTCIHGVTVMGNASQAPNMKYHFQCKCHKTNMTRLLHRRREEREEGEVSDEEEWHDEEMEKKNEVEMNDGESETKGEDEELETKDDGDKDDGDMEIDPGDYFRLETDKQYYSISTSMYNSHPIDRLVRISYMVSYPHMFPPGYLAERVRGMPDIIRNKKVMFIERPHSSTNIIYKTTDDQFATYSAYNKKFSECLVDSAKYLRDTLQNEQYVDADKYIQNQYIFSDDDFCKAVSDGIEDVDESVIVESPHGHRLSDITMMTPLWEGIEYVDFAPGAWLMLIKMIGNKMVAMLIAHRGYLRMVMLYQFSYNDGSGDGNDVYISKDMRIFKSHATKQEVVYDQPGGVYSHYMPCLFGYDDSFRIGGRYGTEIEGSQKFLRSVYDSMTRFSIRNIEKKG